MPDFNSIASLVGLGILFLALMVFAVYGLIQLLSKKKYNISYLDKYKQLVDVTRMNCPPELYEKKLIKVPDKHFSGTTLGYIYGKNFLSFKNSLGKKAWYQVFLIQKRKRRIYDPFSWGELPKLVVAQKEKIKMLSGYNIGWVIGGIDYEGFFMFSAEGDLTPLDIFRKTADLVGLKEANLTLKKMSKLVEDATEANPQIKANQKVTTELPSRE